MRDITAITQEEIKMFLDATIGGEYVISQIEHNEKNKEVTVGVVTKWGGGTEEDPVSEIEDEFIFGQSNIDEGNFPDDFSLRYKQFLLVRGFTDNPFIDANLLYAAPDMYEALKAIIESGEMPYCYSDRLVIKANQAINKAERSAD